LRTPQAEPLHPPHDRGPALYAVRKGRGREVPGPDVRRRVERASWIYAQQVYLARDAARLGGKIWEATWWQCMLTFSECIGPSEWTDRLERELMEMLGSDDLFPETPGAFRRHWIYARWLTVSDTVSWWWYRFRQLIGRR
jgi:hypothetical protein